MRSFHLRDADDERAIPRPRLHTPSTRSGFPVTRERLRVCSHSSTDVRRPHLLGLDTLKLLHLLPVVWLHLLLTSTVGLIHLLLVLLRGLVEWRLLLLRATIRRMSVVWRVHSVGEPGMG